MNGICLTLWWTSGSGRIELQITLDDAHAGHHQGQCDKDVAALAKVPYIAEQLAAINPDLLAKELQEYGAWTEEERKDHAQNLQRLLWLACGDIVEERS